MTFHTLLVATLVPLLTACATAMPVVERFDATRDARADLEARVWTP